MNTDGLQVGKTRWCHYTIGYHLVWIPKYRRKIFTGAVEAETKKLISQCCEQHDLTLLALETDMDHVHVFVSAPPRLSPSTIAGLLKGHTSRYLPASGEALWERALIVKLVLCWNSRKCISRSYQTLYH